MRGHLEEMFPNTFEIAIILELKVSGMAMATNIPTTFLKDGSNSSIDLTNSILIDIMNHQPTGKKTTVKNKKEYIYNSLWSRWKM
tara:strand:- start:492 stop:746 length:255 start_codon:yes stop_codon:yes gene_type:complete